MLDCVRDQDTRASATWHHIHLPSMQGPVGDPEARDAAVLRQVQVGLVEYAESNACPGNLSHNHHVKVVASGSQPSRASGPSVSGNW